MYIKRKDKTEFKIGYMNDELMLSFPGEFKHDNCIEIGSLNLPTWEDKLNSETLYEYGNLLVTVKELRREFLKKAYNVE